MAADKEVEIRFKQTRSGDAGAELLEEINALVVAQEQLDEKIVEFGVESEEAADAAKDLTKAVGDLAIRSEESGLSMEELGEEAVSAAKKLKDVNVTAKSLDAKFTEMGAASGKTGAVLEKKLGKGALSAGRAILSLQHGVSGLASNLPMLAQSLGAGAGLVGVLGLAAGAAVVFLPKLIAMMKGADDTKAAMERLKEGVKAFNEVVSKEKVEALNAAAQATVEALAREIKSYAAADRAIDMNIAKIRARERVLLAGIDAQASLALARVDREEREGEITAIQAIEKRSAVREEADDRRLKTQGRINKEISEEEKGKEKIAEKEEKAAKEAVETQSSMVERMQKLRRDDLEATKAYENELKELQAVEKKLEETKAPDVDIEGGGQAPEWIKKERDELLDRVKVAQRATEEARREMQEARHRRGGMVVAELEAEEDAEKEIIKIYEKKKEAVEALIVSNRKLKELRDLALATERKIHELQSPERQRTVEDRKRIETEREKLEDADKRQKEAEAEIKRKEEEARIAAVRGEVVAGKIGITAGVTGSGAKQAALRLEQALKDAKEGGATAEELRVVTQRIVELLQFLGKNDKALVDEILVMKADLDAMFDKFKNVEATLANRKGK